MRLSFGSVRASSRDTHGGHAYFSIRDGDPISDGFLLGEVPHGGNGIVLDLDDGARPLAVTFGASHVGTSLNSADIASAIGCHAASGLEAYDFGLGRGMPGRHAVGIRFERVAIGDVCAAPPPQ